MQECAAEDRSHVMTNVADETSHFEKSYIHLLVLLDHRPKLLRAGRLAVAVDGEANFSHALLHPLCVCALLTLLAAALSLPPPPPRLLQDLD